MLLYFFYLTARTHALLEKRKGLKENVGLDFSISFENWFILVILSLIFLKPPLFFFTQISLPSIRKCTFVIYGTYIEPTLLHFCLVACYSCYFVENSESAGRKTALKCCLIWAPSTRIRRK